MTARTAKQEILSEVARELAMRRNLYPKWTAAGKIKQADADTRIKLMQQAHDAIMDELREDYSPRSY